MTIASDPAHETAMTRDGHSLQLTWTPCHMICARFSSRDYPLPIHVIITILRLNNNCVYFILYVQLFYFTLLYFIYFLNHVNDWKTQHMFVCLRILRTTSLWKETILHHGKIYPSFLSITIRLDHILTMAYRQTTKT